MPNPAQVLAHRSLAVLLVGGGLATYVAAKAAVDALVGTSSPTSGRLAIGHWLAIAAVALTALVLGETAVAVSLIFASSVVCLTLGVGSLVLIGKTVGPTTRRPAAAMLLPAALLAFLAGFHGRLSLTHAAALMLLGTVAALLWNDAGAEESPKLAIASRGNLGVRSVQLLLAICLACLGGWAAVHGLGRLHLDNGIATPAVMTVTLLAPLLVLPALGAGIDLAQRHRSAIGYDSLAGIVLLNLCLLLPVCAVEANLHPLQRTAHLFAHTSPPVITTRPASQPTTQLTTQFTPDAVAAVDDTPGLPIPRITWRVDAVALIVLGVMFLPVSLGRWPLARGDGLGLIVGYLVYVMLAIALQLRFG